MLAGLTALAAIAVIIYYAVSKGYGLSDFWEKLKSLTSEAGFIGDAIVGTPLQKATALIAGFEGFSAKAYQDADGWSIGYGHFITEDDPYDSNSHITAEEASKLLQQDLERYVSCVDSSVTVDLTDNQRAALYSLCYNIGCAGFQESSLLNLLNNGDLDGAANAFGLYVKSQGNTLSALVNRREAEKAVFLS